MDVHAFTLREKATLGSRQDDTFVEEGMGDPNGEIPSKWFHGAADQLHEFLGSGLDLLIITLPLTSLTRSMIGKEQLQILEKKHAFLANVSRGPIVKTDDLVEALNDGTLKGAALDVTDPEPLPPNHPLWKARNVIITPHVSGNSTHYNERVLKILRENLRRRYKGEDLINKVDRSLGY
jgi:phosphoglycerate dehydrogenase-like enzyme